jgi:hypothetical protein
MPRHAWVPGLLLGALLMRAVSAATYFAPEPPTITGAPYSALVKTESTTQFADGNRIVRGNTVRWFRDAQGRTRTERGTHVDASGATQPVLVTISDPVGGKRYVLHPMTKRAEVLPLRPGASAPDNAEPSSDLEAPFALLGLGMGIGANPHTTESAAAESALGNRNIQGVGAQGTRTVRTIPSGTLGNDKPITSSLERWYSPDLGVPLAITQQSSIGGKLTLTIEQLSRAEPDASLFAPPLDYQLRDYTLPVAAANKN